MSRSEAHIVGEAIARVLPVTDKYWFQQSHLLRLNLVLVIPMLSSSVFGYDGKWMWTTARLKMHSLPLGSLMNALQSLDDWKAYFNNPEGALLGTVIAAQSIGCLLALPFVGDLCDRWGRKPVLLAGIIIICIAAAIQTAAVDLAMFIVARLLIGFGGMFSAQPSPMLIAELSYPTHRGKLTSAYWTMFYLGSILSSWATFGTQNLSNNWAWRVPSLVQAGYPLLQLVFLWWVPESPRFLVAKDREHEAAAILQRFHAGDSDTNGDLSPLVAQELAEITAAIQMEKEARHTSWTALVATAGAS